MVCQCSLKASSSPEEEGRIVLPDAMLRGSDRDLSDSKLEVLPVLDKDPFTPPLVLQLMEAIRVIALTAWMDAYRKWKESLQVE